MSLCAVSSSTVTRTVPGLSPFSSGLAHGGWDALVAGTARRGIGMGRAQPTVCQAYQTAQDLPLRKRSGVSAAQPTRRAITHVKPPFQLNFWQ